VDVKNPNWADITLAVAALIALAQLFLMRRAGYAESAMETAKRWNEKSFRDSRARIQAYLADGGEKNLKDEMIKLKGNNSPHYYELLAIPDYFEDLAMMIKYRAITFRIVYDTYGHTALKYWQEFAQLTKAIREKEDPQAYKNFEELGNRIARKQARVSQIARIARKRESVKS
jgi:hypothetical protein